MLMARKSLNAVLAWCAYDWGISAFPVIVTTFVFATYFTKTIAADPITGTAEWGNAIALAGVIIAFLSPTLGAIADGSGRRKVWLGFFTLLLIISSGLLWFAYPRLSATYFTLSCVVIGTVTLNVSMVFYNAMLIDITPESRMGRVSGFGWGAGYFGGLLVLVFAYVGFVEAAPAWLDSRTMAQVRICGPLVALWTFVFALPLFFLVPERKVVNLTFRETVTQGVKHLVLAVKTLRTEKSIGLFLIAQMIYIDGLNTLFVFGGIYAAGTFHMSISEVLLFGIALNAFAGVGSILLAWVDDALGAKNTILLSLVFLFLFGLSIVLVKSTTAFWVLSCLLSLFVGSVQSSSRSFMAQLVPKRQATALFGFYILSGKMSTFLGPWVLGMVTAFFHSQRAGMASVLVFFLLGTVLLCAVPNQMNGEGKKNHKCKLAILDNEGI